MPSSFASRIFSRDWLWGLLLVVAVVLAYQPVWQAGYVWDDGLHVTENPYIIGPGGLKEIWTTGSWRCFPLVLTVFWFEHALWGLAPLPYHLVNLVEHAVCAVLLWRVLKGLEIPGAWLGAALWTLHPLQVESVAWISEMKNTQSTIFFLLTILFYVRWMKTGIGWNYAWMLIFTVLALASKTATLVLPGALCLCVWWKEGRWDWRYLLRLSPVFLMSLVAVIVTIWPQSADAAIPVDPRFVRSWLERIATSGDVIWFYLGKILWPHPLIAIYPRWHIDSGWWISYLPLLAAMTALFILWLKRNSPLRPVFFAYAWFLVGIAPFLGLVDASFSRYSFVEDHLQNLASMAPLALIAAGLVRLAGLVIPKKPRLQASLGAALVLLLGLLSWQRVWDYKDEETLWIDTIAKNPAAWVAYNNLGRIFLQEGRVDEAIAMDRKSLEIDPNPAEAYTNLGNALGQHGQEDAGIAQYRKALEFNPKYDAAHTNLGNALVRKGQLDEAIVQFQAAADLDPAIAQTHSNLGGALARAGRLDEAIEQFEAALEIDPKFAEAHGNLGIAFCQQGRLDKGIAEFQEALRLRPDFTAVQLNLARAQAMLQQANASK